MGDLVILIINVYFPSLFTVCNPRAFKKGPQLSTPCTYGDYFPLT